MKTTKVDVAVIGAGPGGYVAAIKAAQLKKSVALVERDQLGGTCLNYGCIPSKALLDSTYLLYKTQHEADEHGLIVESARIDYAKLQERRKKMVDLSTRGVKSLIKPLGIEHVEGHGRFADSHNIDVESDAATLRVEATDVIIATGSAVTMLPHIEVDGAHIITSTEALELDQVPKSMGIIGGGFIGLEIGSVYSRLGCKVTVIEMMPTVLPDLDVEISQGTEKLLRKQGLEILTRHKVSGAKVKGNSVELTAESNGQSKNFQFEKLLVAVGRRPFSDGLGLDKIGLATRRDGSLEVDRQLRTSAPHIYAIGDIAGGKLLAHKASHEGIVAAEAIAGHQSEMDYRSIPFCVFIEPEVGVVGMSEREAVDAGHKVRVGRFPFRASGKARCLGEVEGFVKVVGDADSDQILGVHILGPHAADMIAEAGLAMAFDASLEDIGLTVHVHPTLAEAFMEAAMAARGEAIHIPNK